MSETAAVAKPLPYSKMLKIVGAVVFVIGMVEVGVGAEAWNFVTNDKYGSWWAAMFVVIAGALSFVATEKVHLQALIGVSGLSIILCFVGMIVDSLGYRRVDNVPTCVDTDTGEVSGNSALEPWAQICAQNTWRLCGCVKSADLLDACLNFDISIYEASDCNLILTQYTDVLLISACFTTFCLAFVTLLFVIAIVSYTKLPVDGASPAAGYEPTKQEPAAPAADTTPAAAGSVELAVKDDVPDATV